MNKTIHLLWLFGLGIVYCPACQESSANTSAVAASSNHLVLPDSQRTTVPMPGAYLLDTAQSLIGWRASYIAAGGHDGRISPWSGQIILTDSGAIQSGDFVINMNSIRNTDIPDPQSKKDLEEHLKSDDFFSSARFPKAYFNIEKVTPTDKKDVYTLEGPLTIKGVTNPISFQAIIHKQDSMVETRAEFFIDRTKWGINHEAGSVFNGFKDALIAGRVKIMLNFVFWQGKPGNRPVKGC